MLGNTASHTTTKWTFESFHKTLKKESIWPHEFANYQQAEVVLQKAQTDYNGSRIHSSLGYLTPDEFMEL